MVLKLLHGLELFGAVLLELLLLLFDHLDVACGNPEGGFLGEKIVTGKPILDFNDGAFGAQVFDFFE